MIPTQHSHSNASQRTRIVYDRRIRRLFCTNLSLLIRFPWGFPTLKHCLTHTETCIAATPTPHSSWGFHNLPEKKSTRRAQEEYKKSNTSYYTRKSTMSWAGIWAYQRTVGDGKIFLLHRAQDSKRPSIGRRCRWWWRLVWDSLASNSCPHKFNLVPACRAPSPHTMMQMPCICPPKRCAC